MYVHSLIIDSVTWLRRNVMIIDCESLSFLKQQEHCQCLLCFVRSSALSSHLLVSGFSSFCVLYSWPPCLMCFLGGTAYFVEIQERDKFSTQPSSTQNHPRTSQIQRIFLQTLLAQEAVEDLSVTVVIKMEPASRSINKNVVHEYNENLYSHKEKWNDEFKGKIDATGNHMLSVIRRNTMFSLLWET